MKNTILGFVAVVATVVGVAYVTNTSVNVTTPAPVVNVEPSKVVVQPSSINVPATVVNVPKQTLGAVSTPDFYTRATFLNGAVFSSPAATTSVTATLKAVDLIDKTTILDSGFAARTLTFPATSTLSNFLPKAGDRTTIMLVNQGTTTITLAGGTGTLLYTASSTKIVPTLGVALLYMVRKANGDIAIMMSSGY